MWLQTHEFEQSLFQVLIYPYIYIKLVLTAK